jgi:sortase A
MAMYRYVKEVKKKRIQIPRVIPFLFMALGFFVLLWTVWPILAFTTFTEQLLAQTVSPVSDRNEGAQTSALASMHYQDPTIVENDSVYANANTWFPMKPQKKGMTTVNTYTVTIPKLKIENAMVTVAGDDLNTSLIHYGGTPLPGQYGNAVIFGHSTLPQFYNPKNYKTIFSLLPSMQKGDEIFIHNDGVDYRYVVYDLLVVEPTDLSPLEQRFDDSYITVVTCVPPGTYWKRLNVKAKLEKT